jgi:hypothetical protein
VSIYVLTIAKITFIVNSHADEFLQVYLHCFDSLDKTVHGRKIRSNKIFL